VTAVVASQGAPLTPPAPGNDEWSGTLPLAGVPSPGFPLLRVIAVSGVDSVIAFSPMRIDRAPRLEVSAPDANQLHGGSVRVTARCLDDAVATCRIVVRAEDPDHDVWGSAEFDQAVDVSRYLERRVTLTIRAFDSLNQTATVERSLLLTANPGLAIAATAPSGVLLDATADHLLALERTSAALTLMRVTRATGVVDTIIRKVTPGAQANATGSFFGNGDVIFALRVDSPSFRQSVQEWRGGGLTDLATLVSFDLTVRGGWASWNAAGGYYVRNLATATTTLVAANAGNNSNDLLPNGDVAYWKDGQVHLVRGGVDTQITSAVAGSVFPRTDGTRTIFTRLESSSRSIILHDGATEIPLVTGGTQSVVATHYAIVPAWIAYARPFANGLSQIWVRAADGGQVPVSPGGAEARIANLHTTGEVVYTIDNRGFRAPPGGPATAIGPEGRYRYLNGQLHVLTGNLLIRVD
jgi:hypothetical protein